MYKPEPSSRAETVCPADRTMSTWHSLLGDIKNAIAELEKLDFPTPTRMAPEKNLPVEAKMFNHGGRRHKMCIRDRSCLLLQSAPSEPCNAL